MVTKIKEQKTVLISKATLNVYTKHIFNDSEELIKNLKSPHSFTLFPFYLSAVIYIYDCFTHNITVIIVLMNIHIDL